MEFDSVALIGFFSYIEERCSGGEWLNALAWLESTSSLAQTWPTGEVISGTRLQDCDYTLSNPQVSVSSRICVNDSLLLQSPYSNTLSFC